MKKQKKRYSKIGIGAVGSIPTLAKVQGAPELNFIKGVLMEYTELQLICDRLAGYDKKMVFEVLEASKMDDGSWKLRVAAKKEQEDVNERT